MTANSADHQEWLELICRWLDGGRQPSRDQLMKQWKQKARGMFVDQSLIEQLLAFVDFRQLPKNEFIDYGLAMDYYHPEEVSYIALKFSQSDGREVRVPYKIAVDFKSTPHARITVVPPVVTSYQMEQDVIRRTNANFDAFMQKNPKTTDGPILRLSRLIDLGDGMHEVSLEHGTYFSQVRTNLTLDFRPPMVGEPTLREFDLGVDRRLKPFDESIMVNSIGASAVLYYSLSGRRFIFSKIRSSKVAVFPNMLGTVSGVVEYVPGLTIHDLVSHAEREVLREVRRETGIDYDAGHIVRIDCLSLGRELSRGGKPQFFFLIEVRPQAEATFSKLFKESPEGLLEFLDNYRSNMKRVRAPLSPEYATNLMLGLRALDG